jgi:hypothetical protein
MGVAYSGAFMRTYRVTDIPYASAAKWGTGVNPIHAEDMNPPRGGPNPRDDGLITKASDAYGPPGFIEEGPDFGYDPDDLAGLDVFADPGIAIQGYSFNADGWNDWDETTPETRGHIDRASSRPWQAGSMFNEMLRAIRGGPNYRMGMYRGITFAGIPTETVSEGWVNKPASGMDIGEVADAQPSDDSQIFVQTSMTQRYREQNNDRATERGTDASRTAIKSRVVPMKVKEYSGEERHYDMFPRQIDDIPRPFWYRTAGTGPQEYLKVNHQYVIDPLQRTPPPDPSMGIPDTELGSGYYGYQTEDASYINYG